MRECLTDLRSARNPKARIKILEGHLQRLIPISIRILICRQLSADTTTEEKQQECWPIIFRTIR